MLLAKLVADVIIIQHLWTIIFEFMLMSHRGNHLSVLYDKIPVF